MGKSDLMKQLEYYTLEQLSEMKQLYDAYKQLPECQEAVKILLEIIKI